MVQVLQSSPLTPVWDHIGPDALPEGGPLRLAGSASAIMLELPQLCRQGNTQLHPDGELTTSRGSLSHRRFQMPALY